MKLTRRRVIVLLAIFTVIGSGLLWLIAYPILSVSDADRIKIGMTRTELVAILGRAEDGVPDEFSAYWNTRDGVILVIFSGNEVGGVMGQQLNLYERLRWRILGH